MSKLNRENRKAARKYAKSELKLHAAERKEYGMEPAKGKEKRVLKKKMKESFIDTIGMKTYR